MRIEDSGKRKAMQTGGRLLSEIMFAAINFVTPGKSLSEINRFIEKAILAKKALPSFKTVRDYRWASCLNLNEGVVHGIPHPDVKIKTGDYLSIDIGAIYQGYHTDMAYTLKVADDRADEFLFVGKRALNKAIEVVKDGGRVGSISQQIQRTIEGAGYTCVESLTGHGVGKMLHQEPFIPLVLTLPIERTPMIFTGQALAIEVIYTKGEDNLVTDTDGWTIKTQDGKISALFEKTVFVDDYQAEVLTPFFWEENVQKGK
jgi:methionyl aminopeptidase